MTKSLIPISIKSEGFGPLIFRTKDSNYHFYRDYSIMQSMGDEHHNLYFIEDAIIQPGETVDSYCFCLDEVEYGEKETLIKVDKAANCSGCRRIVATTNQELNKQGIPSIPDEYIRHYAFKDGDIGAVDIETENFYVEPPETMHSNRGHFIDIPKLRDEYGQKEVVIYHEPAPMVDWNKFTMTQFIEHLEEEFMFSSTGTAKSVFELIRAYKNMQEGIEWIKEEYSKKSGVEQDAITEKINKLLE